ncbi:hypothetical protein LIER_32563 [Lithospermum erythrorhizon]|uniref:RNase H type-1 domain-containing protein n=1 Tax=Lithospermum erythrorhizon TaxID=34254 RepID=A0AAV3RWP5_LITER
MRGAETRYPLTEKLVYSLIVAARKIKPYSEAYPIEVVTDQPLRQILEKPNRSERIVKLEIELSKFDFRYKPRTSIKAQTIANFMVEYFASNPSGSGEGILLWSPEGNKIEYALRFAYKGRNPNEAEYEALSNGLSLANGLGAEHIHIRTDFQLLVGHVQGDFKIDKTKERLVGYLRRVRNLARRFRSLHMEDVTREKNQEADKLSQLATVVYGTLPDSTTVEWVAEEDFRTKRRGVLPKDPPVSKKNTEAEFEEHPVGWGPLPEIFLGPTTKMRHPRVGFNGGRRDGWGHVWKPHQWKSPDVEDPTVRNILAIRSKRCPGPRTEMRFMPEAGQHPSPASTRNGYHVLPDTF